MFQVVNKIRGTRVTLLKWQQTVFKGRQEKVNVVCQKLGFILFQALIDDALAERNRLMQQLDQLLGQEEIY